MLFLLRQRLVLFPAIVASIVWGLLLVGMTVDHGKGTPETIATMVVVSIVCGLGTTVIVVGPAFMIYRHSRTANPVYAIEPGEVKLFVALANHMLDGEARGGRLIVTDRRIGFRPHRYNVQLETWSTPFDAVRAVRDRLPTYVLLDLHDGRTERLVVQHRKDIAAYLDGLRRAEPAQRAAVSSALCEQHALFTRPDD